MHFLIILNVIFCLFKMVYFKRNSITYLHCETSPCYIVIVKMNVLFIHSLPIFRHVTNLLRLVNVPAGNSLSHLDAQW